MTPAGLFLDPPPLDAPIIYAIKALAKGEADASDQKLAINFIVVLLSRANDQCFVPNDVSGGQNTAFLEGKRFVGRELRRIIDTPSEELLGKQQTGRLSAKVKNA